MSRFIPIAITLGLILGLGASSAVAQIEPMTVAKLIQDEQVVGVIRVDLPPGPCSSVEQWFLYEDYHYPGAQGDSFTVEPASPADGSLEGFLAAQYAVHPKGTLVTVEVKETSLNCP